MHEDTATCTRTRLGLLLLALAEAREQRLRVLHALAHCGRGVLGLRAHAQRIAARREVTAAVFAPLCRSLFRESRECFPPRVLEYGGGHTS